MEAVVDLGKVYDLGEITAGMVDWLKENPGEGIMVNTGKAVKRVVSRYYVKHGQREFSRFEQYSMTGSWSSGFQSLSRQLQQVFEPERYQAYIEEKKARDTERKSAAEAHGPIPVGTIFEGSYGYDATFSEFWQVVRSTEKSVWVRRLCQTHEPCEYGGYCDWMTSGIKDRFRDDVDERRCLVKWNKWGGEWSPSISIGIIYLTPWNGEPVHNDDYH